MRLRPVVVVAALAAVAGGCTSISVTRIPWQRGSRETFVTTSDLTEPYRSLGVLQATRRGVLLFGFLDPGGANVEGALGDLLPEVRQMGGDAIIHIEFLDENPSTDAERVQAATETVASFTDPNRTPQVQRKDRYVTATGEVIQFLE